jgi:HSP20 family molecular chaperone IbpA
MKCANCVFDVKKEWNFCPNCGFILKKEGFEKIEKIALQELNRIGKTFFSMLGIPAKISVRMMDQQMAEQNFEMEDFDYRYEPMEQKNEAQDYLENVEEPNTIIDHLDGRIFIKISLPEVSKENIKISKMRQSIEVKARSPKKAYFKLIPLPGRYRIIKSEFKDNVLNIELSA